MKKKLEFLVTNYQVSIWPLCMLGEMLMYYLHKLVGASYFKQKIGEWQNRTNRWAVDKGDYDKIAKIMLAKVGKNPAWAWKMARNIPTACAQFLKFTKSEIFHANLKKKTDQELYNLYMKYRQQYINTYVYCWFPNALEGMNSIFTKRLEIYLKEKLNAQENSMRLISHDREKSAALKNGSGLLGKYLSVISTPLQQSARQKEEMDFLQLIIKISKYKNFSDRLIAQHWKKYCWLTFDYDGPAWNKQEVVNRVRSYIKQGIDPKKQLLQMTQEQRRLKALQKQYIREFGLDKDKHCAYLFSLARELMYLKDFRKDVLFQSYYHVDFLIREISRRLDLTPVQVKHILPQEMKRALVNEKYNANELNERIKYSVLTYDKKSMRIFTGQEAKAVVRQNVQQDKIKKNIKELKGECAYSGLGKVKGVARLVLEVKDMAKMRQGDILVSVATNPNLLPAMRKAGAIITDKGGITSHAAIISRELKISCVTGTKIASRVLKDGDRVEVDAGTGTCRIL